MIYATNAEKIANLEELRDRISHIYLRRTTEEIKLPEKRIHELYYDLTEEQQKEYDRNGDNRRNYTLRKITHATPFQNVFLEY